MKTLNVGALVLAASVLIALPLDARAAGDLEFYNGYAVFDFGPSLGLGQGSVDSVTMEAHARASNVGHDGDGALVVRVEFPRPLMTLTAEPAYGILVLELPLDVLEVQHGGLQAGGGFFDALYYEVSAEDNTRLFTSHRWNGELSWLHPPDPMDGDLRLTSRLRMEDRGPDGEAGTGDDRLRDLTALTIRLFLTLDPVPLPGGVDVYVPEDEIYVSGAVVTYYDDGCSDDPTVNDYDDYYESGDSDYYGEDDSGCDGDTWDDDDWDSGDDSGCDDDWDDDDDDNSGDWDSDTDWGGWEGDDWAAPRAQSGRISGMALSGLLHQTFRAHQRMLRVGLPLALVFFFILGLKRISRRRLLAALRS